MESLLDTISWFAISLIVLVLISIRREHIRVEYSVSWLAAGVLLLLLSRWQYGLQQLGHLINAPDPVIALLLLIGAIFLLVFFWFSTLVSELKENNIALAQKVALLEYHLQSIRDELEKEKKAQSANA